MHCHVFLGLTRPYGPAADLLVAQLQEGLGCEFAIDDRRETLRCGLGAFDADVALRLVRASLAVYRGWDSYVDVAAKAPGAAFRPLDHQTRARLLRKRTDDRAHIRPEAGRDSNDRPVLSPARLTLYRPPAQPQS